MLPPGLWMAAAAAGDLLGAEPLDRRLTGAELGYCRMFLRWQEHAAARVLAKHLVLGALAWPGPARWHDVELVRTSGAAPAVVLHGPVEAWRLSTGLPVPGVSLSHARGHAAALGWLPQGGR